MKAVIIVIFPMVITKGRWCARRGAAAVYITCDVINLPRAGERNEWQFSRPEGASIAIG